MANIMSRELNTAMKTFANVAAKTFSDNYQYFWDKGVTYIDAYLDTLLPLLRKEAQLALYDYEDEQRENEDEDE